MAETDRLRGAPGCAEAGCTFPDLVRAHFDWIAEEERSGPGADEARAAYRRLLAAFEREHGRIVNAYWCTHVASAAALTSRRRLLRRPALVFHRASDWATKGEPDIAGQLHRCDEIAVRARTVLTGLRRSVCLELVMASAGHLLSLVDARAAHDEPAKTGRAVEEERKKLDEVDGYYRDAANGQAQMVYVGGMALVAAVLGVLALLGGLFLALPGADEREFYGTLLAGAFGAVISVIQRINTGRFRLEFDVGRPYLVFLGGLRPLMGGVFGLVLYFAVASAIVELSPIPDEGTARFYALVVLAFTAGFSERWAQDTLIAAAAPRKRQPAEEERPEAVPAPEPS